MIEVFKMIEDVRKYYVSERVEEIDQDTCDGTNQHMIRNGSYQ